MFFSHKIVLFSYYPHSRNFGYSDKKYLAVWNLSSGICLFYRLLESLNEATFLDFEK